MGWLGLAEASREPRNLMAIVRTEPHRAIGRAVAVILARHGVRAKYSDHIGRFLPEDYALLDGVIGRKVDRESKVSHRTLDCHHGYLGWIVSTYGGSCKFNQGTRKERESAQKEWDTREKPEGRISVAMRLRGEVDHLTEMVRLARERRP